MLVSSRLGLALALAPGPVGVPGETRRDPFRQLEETWPTPTSTRTASGAPGHAYWQQKADYDIEVELDDVKQRLRGRETIDYTNRSPDELRYLWLQLDANIFAPNSDAALTAPAPDFERVSYRRLGAVLARARFDGGVNITAVTTKRGRSKLKYTIVKTMMRIDLPKPLRSGKSIKFSIEWDYAINDARKIRGRTGYEYFEKDENHIYEMAQWFPRMVAYTDVNGWQHKQFLGSGEFTLELGDYEVRITVPSDHIVAATGTLRNPRNVLTKPQRDRLSRARKAGKPLFIVTPEEALKNESSRSKGTKTWIFGAKNVRDFAWASSRKFIWDAQGHHVGGAQVLAMSFYPKEGQPLWHRYSTRAIIHTLNVYSRYTFEYPYPVAISVNGPIGGMEYPMICFNGPRPEEDGTYSKRTKYGLISVIIHEVGHNYFPMIVNSDERQWTWMDEGLNTFLQYLSEAEWERDYPSRRGEPRAITGYMSSERQVPIMTNSESLLQFGNNAYAKPATALNVLRETVLGRRLFDYAFKEYARRWKFRRPMPSDFFRTMEDASGVDLDWFWRGWFYTTDHTDLAIDGLRLYTIDDQDPDHENAILKAERDEEPQSRARKNNRDLPRWVEQHEGLKDFYNDYDSLDVTVKDRKRYQKMLGELDADEKKLLAQKHNFYVVDIQNVGGLVMPVILAIKYTDGSREEIRIPAEIWRRDSRHVSKLILTDKTIDTLVLDPHLETADTDLGNNFYPPRPSESRFKLFKRGGHPNPMQDANKAKEKVGSTGGTGEKKQGGRAAKQEGAKAAAVPAGASRVKAKVKAKGSI
ncbi:MAG: M1 family metallopeptidase [Nannocystaceae bacterium]